MRSLWQIFFPDNMPERQCHHSARLQKNSVILLPDILPYNAPRKQRHLSGD